MTGPASVDSWFEFIIWAAIAAAGFVGSTAAIIAARKSHDVKEQVQNSHSTNLRDDLDRNSAKVDEVDTKVDRLTGVVDAMHQAQTEFMRDIRAQMARQDRIAARHHPEES